MTKHLKAPNLIAGIVGVGLLFGNFSVEASLFGFSLFVESGWIVFLLSASGLKGASSGAVLTAAGLPVVVYFIMMTPTLTRGFLNGPDTETKVVSVALFCLLGLNSVWVLSRMLTRSDDVIRRQETSKEDPPCPDDRESWTGDRGSNQ